MIQKLRIVAKLFTNAPSSIRAAMGHLEPIIKDRLAKADQFGKDWPEKPVGASEPATTPVTDFYTE